MAVRIVFGDVYSLLVEWLASQRRPFVVTPNVTASRVLEERLIAKGHGDVARNLMTGRMGRLAAELVGPGEEISTIDLVVEREILRGLLPPEYKPFGDHDAFMDQVVREVDDLRRNCPSDDGLAAASLVTDAGISDREQEAFRVALRLMQRERETVAPLGKAGIFLGGDLIRTAAARVRAGAVIPWSGIAVVALHRLDLVSRELLLTLASEIDVVLFPGPGSAHVRRIAEGWGIPQAEKVDGCAAGSPLVRRYLLGHAEESGRLQAPTIEAFPDREREVRGVIRAVLSCCDQEVPLRECLVAAPRVDRYADAVAAVCTEFEVAYHVAGLRFFGSLPVDRLAQSILRYLTAPNEQEAQALGELLTRAGCRFDPFRILALRDRVGAGPCSAKDWTAAARRSRWPSEEVNRLEQIVKLLSAERDEWQTERPAVEWLRRMTRLLTALDAVENLGLDLVRRSREGPDAEIGWEGLGTRRYLERVASFSQTLAAGARLPELSWGCMRPKEFVRLFTSEVSFGSYLPSRTELDAVRFVDIEDVLFQDVRHLWVLDFREGALPVDYVRPFVVPERVRERLALRSGILTRERHLLLQRGNFEKVFSAPRNTLHLTYPYQDERGHTRLPSPFALAYGLVMSTELEDIVRRRRQAHEYFPRVPMERPTLREAIGLAVQGLHAPAPPETDKGGVIMAGSVRHISGTLKSHVEDALSRGARFVEPPAVVDLRGCHIDSTVLSQPVPVDHLLDSGRCPFRVYARSVLHLVPPRRERWPEEPLWAIEQVLKEVLADNPRGDIPGGPGLLCLCREAARRAVRGEDSIETRTFQEYVARRAYEYLKRVFDASGPTGGVRKFVSQADEIEVPSGGMSVKARVSRVDEVDGRRVAVLLLATPSAVKRMWEAAFNAQAPAEGGDPRPAAAAMAASPVDGVELHSLAPKREYNERGYEMAVIDREEAADASGHSDSNARHLGERFDQAATESLKAALEAVVSAINSGRFELNWQAGACNSCGFATLCQRRWLPFPQDQGRS